MAENYYDKASRFAARLDPGAFFAWLLRLPAAHFAFRGWLDTRGVPFPGSPDSVNDTVARLDNTAEHGVPWAVAVEFQIQPDADMFGRLLGYLSALWLNLRPDAARGSRFHVGAAVVNLTGAATASRALVWAGTDLVTRLGIVERNLTTESAAELLDEIAAGRLSRCLLPWVPLMSGGCDAPTIDRWKALAAGEPNTRRRSELSGLALLFATKAGCRALWDTKLEGWNVETPSFVQEWIDVGEVREARGLILRLGAKRFGPVQPDTETAIRAINDRERLERMADRLFDATDWAALLATP